MRDDTKVLVRLIEGELTSERPLLKFGDLAFRYSHIQGVPLRDAIDLVDRRWRTLMQVLRRRDHVVVTTTTWYGVQLGPDGIARLTDDRDIKRCIPGNGNGNKAEAFLLASDDNHPVFIAEWMRLGLIDAGVKRTQYGQLADATAQMLVSEDDARMVLSQQPKRLTLTDLRRIGVERGGEA